MSPPLTVDELRVRLSSGFFACDYFVLFCALIGCAAVGVGYVFRGRRSPESAEEYFLAGRSLGSFQVGISLTASFVSGLIVLGAPAESYLYGTEYMFVLIAFFLAGIASSYLFLPVFHEMKVFSLYEYLERRFDENVKLFGLLMFAITQICWLPVVIYFPALAFHRVIGVDVHVVTPSLCALCIFYACSGGLRGVVRTEILKILLTLGCLLLLTIKGTLDVGGFQEVWRRNDESGRLAVPTFDWDLSLRHNFWGVTVGGFAGFLSQTIVNQNLIQMYLSLPSLSHARRASWTFVFAAAGLFFLSCCVGLVTYATYHDCDPLTTALATDGDQLLPLLAANVAAGLPGLSGLIAAGVFAASLSSFSAGLVSTSALVFQEFVKPLTGKGMSARGRDLVMKGLVLLSGLFFSSLIILLDKMKFALRLPLSLASMTSGPMLGLFFGGMFLPWINAKGALLGGILGLFGNAFVVIGAQNAIAQNKLKFPGKPTSVEACLYYYNATAILSLPGSDGNGHVFPLFRLGHLWHTAFGALVAVASAVAISAVTGFTDVTSLDPICVSPAVRRLLRLSGSRTENRKLLN